MQQGRHALLIAAHRLPSQLHRLVERLEHPRLDLFLHVDRRVDLRPFLHRNLTPVERRLPVAWNGFSLVETTLFWLRSLQTRGYRSFTYLSGQDYPAQSVEQILAQFDAGRDFLLDTAWSADDRTSRWGRFHVTDLNPWIRLKDRFRRKFVPSNRGIRKLPCGLEFKCGSALWTIPSRALDWMIPFLGAHPEVERYFKNTLHSDEMFYQMVLNQSPFALEMGDHGHFIDWSRGAPHPEVLNASYLDQILPGKHLFVRKVEPDVSGDLMDRLDQMARSNA
ncbi:MAG: hypothetical protein IPN71_11795 [Fibrobacteres bacterium]|nr:hypothetical protein [Fibrobacterota bacterium]